MGYNDAMPEFLSKDAVKIVNKRFDITEDQYLMLQQIDEYLKIPPSAIVRLALNTFIPKVKDSHFKYEGIKKLWNDQKF